jgi:preprotein translocase subunit SecA
MIDTAAAIATIRLLDNTTKKVEIANVQLKELVTRLDTALSIARAAEDELRNALISLKELSKS